MNELADFILRYDLSYRKWDRQAFLDWLQWFADHQLLLKAIDLDGKIAGVLIVRTIMKAQQVDEPFAVDPEGNVIYVELMIAANPAVTLSLAFAGIKRFGQRDYVAWKRPPYFVTHFRRTKGFLRLVLGSHLEKAHVI